MIWDALIETQSNMTKTEVWLPVIHNLEINVLAIRMTPLFQAVGAQVPSLSLLSHLK